MRALGLVAGLMTVALVQLGCRKTDDSNNSGPSIPGVPNADAVVPGFKNTAKSGEEVGETLRKFAKQTSDTSFRLSGGSSPTPSPSPTATASPTVGNALQIGNLVPSLAALKNLRTLEGTDLTTSSDKVDKNDVIDAMADLEEGADCSSAISKLSKLYDQEAKAIKDAGDSTDQLEDDLPKGFSKGPATDQYAVTYAFNVTSEEDKETVLGTMGFGANADKSIIGLSMDLSTEKGTAHLDSLTVVTPAKKTIDEMSFISIPGDGSVKYNVQIVGGDKPSFSIDEAVIKGKKKGSASVKIVKTAADTIQIDASSGSDSASLTLKANAIGKCVANKK